MLLFSSRALLKKLTEVAYTQVLQLCLSKRLHCSVFNRHPQYSHPTHMRNVGKLTIKHASISHTNFWCIHKTVELKQIIRIEIINCNKK